MPDTPTKPSAEQTVIVHGGRRPMEPPYVVIVDGPRRGSRFPIHEGENVAGRVPGSHILLEDQSVSRRHCLVLRDAETIRLRDLGSKNGTTVNGAVLTDEPVHVGHGDLVQIGLYTLRIINRQVATEEEMAPPREVIREVPEQRAEPSAETSTVAASDVEAGDAPSARAGDGDAVADGRTMIAIPARSPRPRWVVWLGVGSGIVLLGIVVWLTAQHWLPSSSTRPPPLVARQIPVVPGEVVPSTAPAESPLFLDFASRPMPARVVFQEKDYGLTPVKANLPLKVGELYVAEGHFRLREFNEEYVERVSFTVEAGPGLIPIFFRAPIGVLKIEKLPRDVELSLEGYFAYDQFTKRVATLQDVSYGKPVYLPYGRYVIELRQQKEIGATGQFVPDIRYRRELLLSEDAPLYAVAIPAQALTVFPVEIQTTPLGADVFVDTRPIGTTPWQGSFPLGEHTLVVRKEGYLEESRLLQNDINTPVQIDITLKTTPAGEVLLEGKRMIVRGRFKEAVGKLAGVFEKNPAPVETAQAQYLLGTAFLGLSDLATAQGYFAQAEAHPDFALRAKLGMVRIMHREGKRLEALPRLVEVMLRARDEGVLAEARAAFKELSPLKSVIYVHTEPSGATVLVNGEPMKTRSPMILHDLGLGNYRLRVELEGYQPKEVGINLTVHEMNPVVIQLEPVEE